MIERRAGSVETIKEEQVSFPIFESSECLYVLALRIASTFPSADESPLMYVPDPSPAALASRLRKTTAPDEVAVVFLGDAHKDAFSEWERLGAETDCPVVVGLFPGVVDGAHWHREGAVVLSVPAQGRSQVLDLTGPFPDPTEGGRPSPNPLFWCWWTVSLHTSEKHFHGFGTGAERSVSVWGVGQVAGP